MAETGHILLKIDKNEDIILISVSDNGISITDETNNTYLINNIKTRLYGFYPKGASVVCYVDEKKINHMELSITI